MCFILSSLPRQCWCPEGTVIYQKKKIEIVEFEETVFWNQDRQLEQYSDVVRGRNT